MSKSKTSKLNKPKVTKNLKEALDYIETVSNLEHNTETVSNMITLNAKQIRELKPGNKVIIDGNVPIIDAGEQTLDKIVLWPGGGSAFFRNCRHCFALSELASMNIKGEPLEVKDRHYC